MESYSEGLLRASRAIGVSPAALDTVIYSESNGRDLKAVNPSSKATGLIQFMPETAEELGTTIDEIYNMGYKEQFDLVIRYFEKQMQYNNISHIDRDFDVYTLVFVPAYVNYPLDFVLPQKYYAQNKNIFDKEGKGFININDIKQRFDEIYKYDYADINEIAENLPVYASSLGENTGRYIQENPKKSVLLLGFLLVILLFCIYE